MRYVVELSDDEGGVHGTVTREGSTAPEGFTGWLELLRILEEGLTGVPAPEAPV
jgi:hypothetical protein